MPYLYHAFVSAKTDSADSGLVRPTNWNDRLEYSNAAATGPSGTDAFIRQLLTANTTFYVSTTGSDVTGTGAVGAPWATIQFASDWIASNIDGGGWRVYIQLANGTYSSAYITTFSNVYKFIIQGNTSDASLVIIQDDGYTAIDNLTTSLLFISWVTLKQVSGGACLIVDGQFTSTSINNSIIDGGTGAGIGCYLQSQMGVLSFGFDADGSSQPNTIKGNFTWFIRGLQASTITHAGATTISGTPAFSQQYIALNINCSYLEAGSYVNAASATGTRYLVAGNSVFDSNGAGVAYLPGNGAGSTATGGQYI